MDSRIKTLWHKVREPRTISALYFLQYVVLLNFGGWLIFTARPPETVPLGDEAIGALVLMLVVGGLLGSIAALPGIYWLERPAVLFLAASCGIYLYVLAVTPTYSIWYEGFQGMFATIGVLQQGIRWFRISERPYRPMLES